MEAQEWEPASEMPEWDFDKYLAKQKMPALPGITGRSVEVDITTPIKKINFSIPLCTKR